MNITKRSLREIGLYNSHDIAKKGNGKVFLSYTNNMSRWGRGKFWEVVGVGFNTNGNGPWYDYGHKTFMMWNIKEKEETLEQAKQWCLEQYGITEWEKDPFGSWHPKGTIKAALAAQAVNA